MMNENDKRRSAKRMNTKTYTIELDNDKGPVITKTGISEVELCHCIKYTIDTNTNMDDNWSITIKPEMEED